MTKTCTTCKEVKSLDAFSPNGKRKDGSTKRAGACKVCSAERLQGFRSTLSDEQRQAWEHEKRAARYHVTVEQLDAYLATGCLVCGTHEDLHIDHDHNCCPKKATSCGKCIRGALCARHNKAEGLLNGSVEECMALAAYLLQFQSVLQEVSNGD